MPHGEQFCLYFQINTTMLCFQLPTKSRQQFYWRMSKFTPKARRQTQNSDSLGSSVGTRQEFLPRLRGRSTASKKEKDFNRYYVRPALRYRMREENPKSSPQKYEDEAYIYKNLHNHRFWNWSHPLQSPSEPQISKSFSMNVSIPALQRFKSYIETLPKKRVPLLIQEILNHKD